MSDPALQQNEFDGTVSPEDQKEILIEIDRVANENRLRVTDDLFVFTAQKNGAIFPILVNVVGIALLGGGIMLMAWLFRAQEQSLQDTGRVVATTESRLIEEIRREAEAQLAAKEAEISQIEQQLATINNERNTLLSNMQTQIATRETELREEFNQELEAERARLRALNLSEAEIAQRLSDFEETRRQEYENRLEQFRREQLAEQQRLENDLNNLEQQFSRTLAQASQEREALARESEQRLQAVQQEFQQQMAASQRQLGEAEAQLQALNEQRRRETLVRGQISGLYRATSDALGRNDFEAARARLRDLRTLLNEESTLRIEALREQRPVELFLVSSLEQYISLQERFGNPETLQRLNDAALIQRVSELTTQASAAAQAGDANRANQLYSQAMRVIPSVAEGYDYFEQQRSTADVAQTQAINDAASAVIDQARALSSAGNHTQAIEQFSVVLSTYPTSRFRQTAISGIQSSVNTVVNNFTASAATMQSEADALSENIAVLTAERDQLLETRATLTTERDTARQRITALEGDLTQARTQITQLQGELAAARGQTSTAGTRAEQLQQDLERAREREAALQQTLTTRNSELSATETRLSDTLNQLARAQGDLAQSRTALAQSQAQLVQTQTELNQVRTALAQSQTDLSSAQQAAAAGSQVRVYTPELENEMNRLRQFSERVATAQSAFESYRNTTGGASRIAQANPAQAVAARSQLSTFLNAPTVSEIFPRLEDEISAFERVYESSGRQNALVDMADVIVDLSLLDTPQQRITAVRRLQSSATDSALREFLTELETLLQMD